LVETWLRGLTEDLNSLAAFWQAQSYLFCWWRGFWSTLKLSGSGQWYELLGEARSIRRHSINQFTLILFPGSGFSLGIDCGGEGEHWHVLLLRFCLLSE